MHLITLLKQIKLSKIKLLLENLSMDKKVKTIQPFFIFIIKTHFLCNIFTKMHLVNYNQKII